MPPNINKITCYTVQLYTYIFIKVKLGKEIDLETEHFGRRQGRFIFLFFMEDLDNIKEYKQSRITRKMREKKKIPNGNRKRN